MSFQPFYPNRTTTADVINDNFFFIAQGNRLPLNINLSSSSGNNLGASTSVWNNVYTNDIQHESATGNMVFYTSGYSNGPIITTTVCYASIPVDSEELFLYIKSKPNTPMSDFIYISFLDINTTSSWKWTLYNTSTASYLDSVDFSGTAQYYSNLKVPYIQDTTLTADTFETFIHIYNFHKFDFSFDTYSVSLIGRNIGYLENSRQYCRSNTFSFLYKFPYEEQDSGNTQPSYPFTAIALAVSVNNSNGAMDFYYELWGRERA